MWYLLGMSRGHKPFDIQEEGLQVATVISGNLTLRVCGLDTSKPYQTWW